MHSKIEELKLRFALFMDVIRIVMLIDRGVMNNNKGSKRWINKSLQLMKKNGFWHIINMYCYSKNFQ